MVTIEPMKHEILDKILNKYDYIFAECTEKLIIENTMVLTENNEIYGISMFESCDDIGFIKVLYVDEDKRKMNFGDGLIKATLNLMDKRKIKLVYISLLESYEFFLKASKFSKVIDEDGIYRMFKINKKENNVLYCADLADYFKSSCKSPIKQ